ncbi:M16 family metallopeptidase [Helicobacter mesocricetorum]|uniref:M16 family metallopeptidase n=1 Tax=Helicobacter mesocricetorum TaxID=87012 RepID=UPI000CF02270|nr:pitrilysin family protein [Helicobacter mesocricetorum]
MAAELKNIEIKGVDIPIIYEQNAQLPLFYMQIIFKGAGGISNGGLYGLSDLVGDILNEGTKSLGVTKFSQKLEEKALSLDVESRFETMSFTLSGMKKESQAGFKLLKALVQEPNFTQAALDKVKEISLASLLEKENDFDYQANRALNAMIFKDSVLEYPLSGTKESIRKITLKNIQDFYQTFINLKSVIVVAGGDIDFLAITQALNDILGGLPEGKAVEIKPIKVHNDETYKRQIKDTQQAYIYFGSPLEIWDIQKESAMVKVASFVLGGSGFGSRMMEEIRVKRGLAYSAVMRLNADQTISYAQGYLQTSISNEAEAKDIVKEVVKEFIAKGITKQELQEAKQYLLGSEPLRNETLSQRLNTAFANYYRGLPLDFNNKILKEIENLKLEDVNAYIKNHQEISQLTFSVVSAD